MIVSLRVNNSVMRQFFFFILAFPIIFGTQLFAQVVTCEPVFPVDNQSCVITFYADQGSGGLENYSGEVYAHTGVITNLSTGTSDWKHVVSNWGENLPETKLERISTNIYELTIEPNIREYYGVPETEEILQIALVFRSDVQVNGSYLEGKTESGGDIFYDVYDGGLNLVIVQPAQPQVLVELGEIIEVQAATQNADSVALFLNENHITSTSENQLNYTIQPTEYGKTWAKVVAYSATEMLVDSFYYYVRQNVVVEELPEGIVDGINYIDDNSLILCLLAPGKEFVFVNGDFNDWEINDNSYMKRTPDGERFWLKIENLEAGTEYAYQYFIDSELFIADPFTNKILDPWNDSYISATNYPNLKPYPVGKASGIVSVFQTAQTPYDWQVIDFEAPEKEDLIIYELHIRDFVGTQAIKTVQDTLDYLQRLGVTAIELMPINEFEGNDSWGYNPAFYFATDKNYGTINDYKAFIDECHRRGIAVITDIVLNHSYGLSPLVQMYFDGNGPTADNPWFNQTCPHEPNCWGYDFNHESQYTKDFVDRVNAFWVNEFKVDGFRFDFTKGFTNKVGEGSAYDASRIAILKRMADKIWEIDPDKYVILEHWCSNTEEKELADYGMMLWGNLNYNYSEATMGFVSSSNFSSISYKSRTWTKPHLIGYMESHDEERQMYRNQTFGNQTNPYHDTRLLPVAVKRSAAAAAMFLLVPGPKMIWQFGELGYDISIDYNCRTCPKPIRWFYQEDWDRNLLFNYYSSLIELRKSQSVFKTTDFSISASGAGKKLRLTNDEMSVVVLANFDVNPITIDPEFNKTGTWYDYYNGTELEVTNTNLEIELNAGEFRIYTTKKLERPTFMDIQDEVLQDAQLNFSVYPNPSSDIFEMNFELNTQSQTTILIYNLNGQLIQTIFDGTLPKGNHHFMIDEENDLAKGMYFIQIQCNEGVVTSKIFKN